MRYRHTSSALLIKAALYSLYSTLVMPYLNYCCEIWGNTYKSRIQPLHIIQKQAIRISQKAGYKAHSRPFVHQLKTLNIHDMVNFKNIVFMYNVCNKLVPDNVMSYFKTINACHNHNVRMTNCKFKTKFRRTTKTFECISVKGTKMWNDMPADIKLCRSMFIVYFKKCTKLYCCNLYTFG